MPDWHKWLIALMYAVLLHLLVAVSGLPLNVLMAFPEEQTDLMSKGLRRTLSDFQREGVIDADYVTLPGEALQVMSVLCKRIREHNASLLVSFLPKDRAFFAAMAAGAAGIPLISLTRNYTDAAAQEMNDRHISLDPDPENLADALFLFLSSQDWYEVTLLLDDTTMSSRVGRRLRILSNGQGLLRVIQLPTTSSKLLSTLSYAQSQRQRVLLLCCSGGNVTTEVFRQAERLGMLTGEWIWILLEGSTFNPEAGNYPIGILGMRLRRQFTTRHSVRAVLDIIKESMRYLEGNAWLKDVRDKSDVSCWEIASDSRKRLSDALSTVIRRQMERESPIFREGLEPPVFDVVNLVPVPYSKRRWRRLGNVTGSKVIMDAVVWLRPSNRHQLWGLDDSFQSPRPPPFRRLQRYRVVTAYSPPFVKQGTRVANGSCLIGVPCLQIRTNDPQLIAEIFADYSAGRSEGILYNVSCCAGVSIDLLLRLSSDLVFDYELYLVADGYFGTVRRGRWNGITADLVSGAAQLTLSAFSMTSARQKVIDFSVPYFHSGVSCLTSSQYREVPLSAFLVPFSIQLWVAIFAGLTVTAVAAAVYEWFSPFGLNPWGRQRTKNFSLASALWVMWSLLFSHLVAFKAPKSWPNKVLINVWGCFSVIFLASYTANIAALFAGLFFHLRVVDFRDASLLHMRTGTAKGSAAEGYVYAETPELWQHIQRYGVETLEEGLEKLRKKELDVLIGDTAVLNYFRGNDPGCNLHLLGDSIFEDAYAVGVQKGFPLTDAISQLLLKYNEYGYLDQLQKTWYGRVPCFDDRLHRFNQPEPLTVHAVAGVFIMLLVGMLVGTVILIIEHLVFKYALPVLRNMPKECVWRSPNLMFFSQKLYRFINTVELVSPHHSAKEIVSNLREGQIASLFQKSVKKKFKEEARRRKSKSQFFEMIQEIRRVVRQQNEPRAPTWEDSRQQLTSPPDSRNVTNIFEQDDDDDDEEAADDDEQLTIRQFRRLPFRHATTEATFHGSYRAIGTSHSAPHSLEASSRATSESSSLALSRGKHVSASTGDIPKEVEVGDGGREWDSFGGSWPRARSVDELFAHRKSPFDFGSKRRVRFESDGEMEEPAAAAAAADHDSVNLTWQWARAMDELRLISMSKEEIVRMWQGSERALLNRLKETLREKKLLEDKLAFLQNSILKPP